MTPAQQEAVVDIVTTERAITRVHGYAGSGKTAAVIAPALGALDRRGASTHVLAPTGKAALRLRQKGLVGAQTIHSYLYSPSKRERREWREAWEPVRERVERSHPGMGTDLAIVDTASPMSDPSESWAALIEGTGGKLRALVESAREAERYRLAFEAAGAISHFEEWGTPAASVLLVDEASMVSAAVAADLARTGSRLVYVGDPAQLPPVAAQVSRDAMGDPHHLLTEVIRQKGADGARVRDLATTVRTSKIPAVPTTKAKRLLSIEQYDQVLCWRNATRERVNLEVRRRLGFRPGITPHVGDRLVCLKNTKPPTEESELKQWMNGEQADVLEVGLWDERRDIGVLTVRDDEAGVHEVSTTPSTLGGHRAERAHLDRSAFGTADPVFAYGFALTVHKAQGSEWDKVLLVDESEAMISMTSRREGRGAAMEQARQWLYTGVTRAVHDLHVVRSV